MWNALQDRDFAEALGRHQRWIRAGTLALAVSGTFVIGFLCGMVHFHGKLHNLPVLSLLHSAALELQETFIFSPECSDLHGGRSQQYLC